MNGALIGKTTLIHVFYAAFGFTKWKIHPIFLMFLPLIHRDHK